MEIPTTLTEKERVYLSLQFSILEKLYPEYENYRQSRIIVERGYVKHYRDLFEVLDEELPVEHSKFVLDVLEMYRGLIFSALELKDTDILKKVTFKGFDYNDDIESRMANYARFFVFDLDRYDEIKENSNGDFSSHRPMINEYERMLSIWQELKSELRYHLGEEDIELILNA